MADQLEHRRANARICILGPDGMPAANRHIQIDQTSHQFLFGCGAFNVLYLSAAKDEQHRALLQEYLDKWRALFNYGTLPFYWSNYEPVRGKTARNEVMAAAKLMKEQGIRLKGHPLCWHSFCAPWLLRYSDRRILRHQLARIRRELKDFKGIIDYWDVVNEAMTMPDFNRYDNAATRICRKLGRTDLIQKLYKEARKSDPNAVLLINDFKTGASYEQLIEELLDKGVTIDAIGIQSHQHRGYWGLEKLQNVLERFSRFGLPIHFTENTLISGELMPTHIKDLNDWQADEWPTTPEGEERQALEIAEMYTILFSHPQVESITTWNLRDGDWLNAPSGLIRKDGSEKPSYTALKGLIRGKWETHETMATDGDGFLSFSGFKGDYSIRSEGWSASFTLEESRPHPSVVTMQESKAEMG